MTRAVVATTDVEGGAAAGAALGRHIAAELRGDHPDVVILFAPPRYEYRPLLQALNEACRPRILIGGSGVGGFTGDGYVDEGVATAVAIRAPEMRFTARMTRGLGADPDAAATDLVSGFEGLAANDYVHRAAIVLIDALIDGADRFLHELILRTDGMYQLFGGGTADGKRLSRSDLFFGTEVASDAAIALEILSNKPLGLELSQGWRSTSAPLRVTESSGKRLVSVNAVPAMDALRAHAAATGQVLDDEQPLPFFLDNVLGVETLDGFKLRIAVHAEPDGSVLCAGEVPTGAILRVMATSSDEATSAALQAARNACAQLQGERPAVALVFDCLASKVRMDRGKGYDPRIFSTIFEDAPVVGFSTCGQIVRAEGQFDGFQNCTAVVCVLPR